MLTKLKNGQYKIKYNNKEHNLTYLGSGGNSVVYQFEDNVKDYAVKVFRCGNNNSFSKRYKRFVREINIIKKNLKGFKGIVPCLYDSCPKDLKYKDDRFAYYIMPKCQRFDIYNGKKIIEKLNDILSLANTLKKIHNKKISHRDIKPQNILIYNNQICFSDFGIAVGQDNPNRLTSEREKIGPMIILPPELQHVGIAGVELEYYKSDIYLLSKVLWMYLNENEYGFYGEYRREDKTKYYNPSNEENIKSFEPLHVLFEKSTLNEIDYRIGIEDFISLLEDQISIINNTIDEKKLLKYINDETIKKLINKNQYDKLIYNDCSIIYEFSNSLLKSSLVKIVDTYSKDNVISIDNCIIDLNNKIFTLKTNIYGNIVNISFCTRELIYNVKTRISTLVIQNNDDLSKGKTIFNEKLINFNDVFYLSNQFVIEIIPKYL